MSFFATAKIGKSGKAFCGLSFLIFALSKNEKKCPALFQGFPLLHFAQRKIQQKLSASFRGLPLPAENFARKIFFGKNFLFLVFYFLLFSPSYRSKATRRLALPRSGGDEGLFHIRITIITGIARFVTDCNTIVQKLIPAYDIAFPLLHFAQRKIQQKCPATSWLPLASFCSAQNSAKIVSLFQRLPLGGKLSPCFLLLVFYFLLFSPSYRLKATAAACFAA